MPMRSYIHHLFSRELNMPQLSAPSSIPYILYCPLILYLLRVAGRIQLQHRLRAHHRDPHLRLLQLRPLPLLQIALPLLRNTLHHHLRPGLAG